MKLWRDVLIVFVILDDNTISYIFKETEDFSYLSSPIKEENCFFPLIMSFLV